MKKIIIGLIVIIGLFLQGMFVWKVCISVEKLDLGLFNTNKKETIQDLLDTTYTILTKYNGTEKKYQRTGTGVAFFYNNKSYILTCGHVAECLRIKKYDHVLEDTMDSELIRRHYTWDIAHIEKTKYQDNREKRRDTYSAQLVAYSGSEDQFDKHRGLDLALLEILNSSFPKHYAKFLPEGEKFGVGERIYHIGSLYGDYTESYLEGYVSRLDMQLLGTQFNVVKLGACPGSSGGGIFVNRNGMYYYTGMLTRGDAATTSLVKPMDVIRNWLKENNFYLDFK